MPLTPGAQPATNLVPRTTTKSPRRACPEAIGTADGECEHDNPVAAVFEAEPPRLSFAQAKGTPTLTFVRASEPEPPGSRVLQVRRNTQPPSANQEIRGTPADLTNPLTWGYRVQATHWAHSFSVKHEEEDMNKLLLRPTEAADVLGISRSKVYALLATGELPGVRIGHSVRIPVSALERWLQAQVAQGEHQAALEGEAAGSGR